MTILVTGGSGFLGKHLCRAIVHAGHELRILDWRENGEFPTMIGDVGDQAVLARVLPGVDVVYHLASSIEAGESVQKPLDYANNNILKTIVLFEAMREHGVSRCIFSSSAAVYGEPVRVPIFEDDRTLPINPYGMTKLAMEGIASSYCYAFNFSVVALRYFNLYGPEENHQPETHAIPRFIDQIARGEEVTVWGNGEHQRDFVYVHDIVDAHLKALQLPLHHFHYFNLSGKNATSVQEVIERISSLVGKPAKITHFPARPGDPLLLFADGSKAEQVLRWKASTELQEGLRTTVEERLSRISL